MSRIVITLLNTRYYFLSRDFPFDMSKVESNGSQTTQTKPGS